MILILDFSEAVVARRGYLACRFYYLKTAGAEIWFLSAISVFVLMAVICPSRSMSIPHTNPELSQVCVSNPLLLCLSNADRNMGTVIGVNSQPCALMACRTCDESVRRFASLLISFELICAGKVS